MRAGLLGLALLLALALGVGAAAGRALATTHVDLTIFGTGTGTVSSSPGGISCSSPPPGTGTCSADFTTTSTIVLTATPTGGSTVSWNCAGAGESTSGSTCQITPSSVDTNHAVAVTFTAPPPPPPPPPGAGIVAVSVVGKGRVTSSPDGIRCGDGKSACSLTFPGAGETLTAHDTADGWTFASWSDWDLTTGAPGPCDGTGGDCTVSDTDDHLITADFSGPPSQTRTLSVSFTGGGTVTGGNTEIECGTTTSDCSWNAPAGSVLSVVETPDAASVFTGWSGDCGGTNVACTVELGGNRAVAAAFAASAAPTLSVDVTGAGKVKGDGIDCPSTCSATEPLNSAVTLTATPGEGSTFTGWTGECAGSAATTCTFTMTADATVGATFAPAAQLSVTVSGNGSVSGGSGAINCGNGATICSATFAQNATVTLVATPTTGATFAGWTGACGGTATTCTVLMSAAKSVAAAFTGGVAGGGLALTVTVTGNGTVTGGGISCGNGASACTQSFAPGTNVTLTATPAAGATFAGWGGACTGTTPSCTVAMTSAKSVTATFQGGTAAYQLTVSVAGAGRVTGAGIDCGNGASACTAGEQPGTTVTLTAVAAPGARFTGWSGACSGTTTTCRVPMTGAKTVSATFTGGSAAGTLTLAVSGRGTVSTSLGACSAAGAQRTCVLRFKPGARVTLTAVPTAGSSFRGWFGACTGTARTCTLILNVGRSVTARFSGAPSTGPAGELVSRGAPIVRRVSSGFRVTLRFTTSKAGLAHVRGLRAGRLASSLTLRVAAGRATIGPFAVAKPGLYTFQLSLGGRSIGWRTCLGVCGAARKRPLFVLARRPPTVTRAGDVWSVTLHLRANAIFDGRVRSYRGRRLLVDQHFLGKAASLAVGPFLLGPGSYTLKLTATDAYGRVRTLSWIVALAR